MMTNEEIATLAYRAIHTLTTLRDSNVIVDDESTATLFVLQTFKDMTRLLDEMKERGVKMRGIDISAYSNAGDTPQTARTNALLGEWNAGEPIRAEP